MKRSNGVLMHLSSLSSNYGIGTLGMEAYNFVKSLNKAGIRYWQLLPLGPTSYGDSPYASPSSFAGNHYFIDLDILVEEGLLRKEEIYKCDFGNDARRVDYGKQFVTKKLLLNMAYKQAVANGLMCDSNYQTFKQKEAYWLNDYALFMSLKQFFNYQAWYQWPTDIKNRYDNAINYYLNLLKDEVEFEKFIQYKFFSQYEKLKEFAHANDVLLIGDLPIYISEDSADVWVNTYLFEYDNNKVLKQIAGCPPDVFSAEGQLWGNPVYNWDANRRENYRFWIARFEMAHRLFDVIRLDHFRGFDTFWSIPAGSKNAINGKWNRGPGMDLFNAVKNRLGDIEMIAEDLGILNDSARKLLADSKYPGMKILHFAFGGGKDNPYLPNNYKDSNCVVYTGTHDNNTTRGWLNQMGENEKRSAMSYMHINNYDDFVWKTIDTAYESKANLAVIPIQDFLQQDETCRMNLPSTLSNANWSYRMLKGEFTDEIISRVRNSLQRFNRL